MGHDSSIHSIVSESNLGAQGPRRGLVWLGLRHDGMSPSTSLKGEEGGKGRGTGAGLAGLARALAWHYTKMCGGELRVSLGPLPTGVDSEQSSTPK